jgi:hypothetical protein
MLPHQATFGTRCQSTVMVPKGNFNDQCVAAHREKINREGRGSPRNNGQLSLRSLILCGSKPVFHGPDSRLAILRHCAAICDTAASGYGWNS